MAVSLDTSQDYTNHHLPGTGGGRYPNLHAGKARNVMSVQQCRVVLATGLMSAGGHCFALVRRRRRRLHRTRLTAPRDAVRAPRCSVSVSGRPCPWRRASGWARGNGGLDDKPGERYLRRSVDRVDFSAPDHHPRQTLTQLAYTRCTCTPPWSHSPPSSPSWPPPPPLPYVPARPR